MKLIPFHNSMLLHVHLSTSSHCYIMTALGGLVVECLPSVREVLGSISGIQHPCTHTNGGFVFIPPCSLIIAKGFIVKFYSYTVLQSLI